MPQCAVISCGNSHRRTKNDSNDESRIRYHRFPPDETVRSLWIIACGRNKPENNNFNIDTARVCSCHFPEEFYEDESYEQIMMGNRKKNRLKSGAVPTIAVPFAVEPRFDLNPNGKKQRTVARHVTRLKIPNPQRISLNKLQSGLGRQKSINNQGPKHAGKEATKNKSATKTDENKTEEKNEEVAAVEAEDKLQIVPYNAITAQRNFMMRLKLIPIDDSPETW